jgi:arginase
MSRVRLIEAPYHLGRADVGLGAGVAPLAEAIGGERTRIRPTGAARNEIAASLDVAAAIAESVREAVADGALPLVLAGNCNSSLGTVTGLGREVGVIWLDSHTDFHTPDTTPSGFFDGFALAMLTGAGWDELRRARGFACVPEERVVLVAREIDDGERRRLERSGVTLTDVGSLDAAVDALGTDDLYVHLDLDVLDPAEARANEWAAPDGPSAAELERVLGSVADRFTVRGAALTAYDPSVDPDGRVPPIAVRLALVLARSAVGAER